MPGCRASSSGISQAARNIAIAFAEEAYSLGLEDRLEYETETLRFTYSSMTTPWETYDYNLTNP